MSVTLKNPATDVAALLAGQTLAGVLLTSGETLFGYRLHPVPQGLVVQVLNAGGAAPEPYVRGTSPAAFLRPVVQIITYAMPGADGMRDGEALAIAVAGALQQTALSGYVSLVAQQAGPTLVTAEKVNRPMWSQNFEAWYRTA